MRNTIGYLILAASIAVGLLPGQSSAAPLFPLPHAGSVPNLPSAGALPFGLGTVLGPTPFGDVVPNPASLHHWEIELNNSLAIPISFNVAIFSFGGPLPITGIALPPGASVYWDIHYPDIPEFGGAYSFFAANPVGSGGTGLTLDRSVVEFAAGAGPGPGGPFFAGPPGGMVIGVLPGVPPITLSVTPEPSSSALAALACLGLTMFRRRKA